MHTCMCVLKLRRRIKNLSWTGYGFHESIQSNCHLSRLMVVSHEVKKKQHARESSDLCNHYSELFTRMAALKFENAITQLLWTLSAMTSKTKNGGDSWGTLYGRPMERLAFRYDRHEEIAKYIRMWHIYYHSMVMRVCFAYL